MNMYIMYVYEYIYIYRYTHTYTLVCAYIYTYVCMYVRMFVCTYVGMHNRITRTCLFTEPHMRVVQKKKTIKTTNGLWTVAASASLSLYW